MADDDGAHGGQQLRRLRELVGLTITEVAAKAGVASSRLAEVEDGIGLADVSYEEWVALARATQPPRPEWWDEGHEHDLSLGRERRGAPATEGLRRYRERVEAVREEIAEHYGRGRSSCA